jgi:hypothetical protein
VYDETQGIGTDEVKCLNGTWEIKVRSRHEFVTGVERAWLKNV